MGGGASNLSQFSFMCIKIKRNCSLIYHHHQLINTNEIPFFFNYCKVISWASSAGETTIQDKKYENE